MAKPKGEHTRGASALQVLRVSVNRGRTKLGHHDIDGQPVGQAEDMSQGIVDMDLDPCNIVGIITNELEALVNGREIGTPEQT